MAHTLAFYREILRGIKSFAEERSDWILTPIAPEKRAIGLAKSLRCDGYIGHLFNSPIAEAVLALGKPVVNVSGVLPGLPMPRVVVDHEEVGRMAARHLIERGVRTFGFVGYPEHDFSLGRERGLIEIAEAAGFTVSVFHDDVHRIQDPTGMWFWNRPLLQWLTSLTKPVGLLTSHDTQGAQVSEYCRQLGFSVPDDVAIVGVDNDDLLCEMSRPSLSSVALPAQRIGYEAATLLDQRMRGQTPSTSVVVLPPVGLVVRQSSDLIAVADPDVSDAVRFIQEHAHQPIRVPDVLEAVPVARRSLERRFRKWLQRSISEEICRVHIERGRDLLMKTNLSMSAIAELSGFTDGRQLSIAFRRETGMTPSDYRRRFRLRP
ncbi:substrate-binding domain-containing protein [Singulisphaera sp. PoT]|uniref:AraC family transcriptional regulator n=1 Tax=Singulisphaera sp. PoT TaxID=3411797 RepID=UPI003BF6134F